MNSQLENTNSKGDFVLNKTLFKRVVLINRINKQTESLLLYTVFFVVCFGFYGW